MVTILNESGQVKVTIDDGIENNYAIVEDKLGKKNAHRIYRVDKTTFRVSIKGIGYIPSVTTLLYEEAHGGCLLFWSHKSIAFRTDSLEGKVISMNLNDDGDIEIVLEEK